MRAQRETVFRRAVLAAWWQARGERLTPAQAADLTQAAPHIRRAQQAARLLAAGRPVTVAEVAEALAMTPPRTSVLLLRLSAFLPIYPARVWMVAESKAKGGSQR
jgi:hypothetical protein